MRPDPDKVILCPDCDLLMHDLPVGYGKKLVCPRCSGVLRSPRDNSVEKTIAMTLAGLFLYLPANLMPLLTFDAAGLKSSGSIWESWLTLVHADYLFVGIMVLLTSIMIPLVKLCLLFVVAFSIRSGRASGAMAAMFRWYHYIDEWGMLEVYMIGILVTIIKMLHLASVQYDTGFYCFIALMMATLCSSAAVDHHLFWNMIEEQRAQRKEKNTAQVECAEDGCGRSC